MVKISPSILAADFNNLEKEVKDVMSLGADRIHVDVMDGKFVNNITPGKEMYEKARAATDGIIETHLMVENPREWILDFKKSDIILNFLKIQQKILFLTVSFFESFNSTF